MTAFPDGFPGPVAGDSRGAPLHADFQVVVHASI